MILGVLSLSGSAQSAHMLPVFCNSDEPTIDLYVAHRYEHFPSLYIRPAIVEDADDLMPIFSHSSSDVKEEYGKHVQRQRSIHALLLYRRVFSGGVD